MSRADLEAAAKERFPDTEWGTPATLAAFREAYIEGRLDQAEAAQRPPVSGGVDWSDTDRPHCVRCGERIWAGQKMTVLPSGFREHQDCACLDALPEVPDDAVIKAMAEGICESLLDLETGPLSDAPYRHAEVNDDGHLELFEALGDWPSAVIDAPQLTRAAYAALRGAMQ